MIHKMYNFLRWLPSCIANTLELKIRGATIAKSAVIRGRIFIRGKGKLVIGNNSIINSSKEANPIGGDTQTTFFIQKGILSIGDNVGISNSTFVVRKKIVIENDVMIGNNCKIYDNDFHSLDHDKRIAHQEADSDIVTKEIRIEKGAFVGAHTLILKGVTIGEYAIIGAGSVVTKDVPAKQIWAGNPARFIREV